jgi:dynein heavy chain, axonemal
MDEKSKRRRVYRLVSEEKPQMPVMVKNFYIQVMENKEIVKTISLLATCTKKLKEELQVFIKKWRPYHVLWKNDKTMRQLLEFSLQEFESSLRCLSDLDANLLVEPDLKYFDQSVALNTEKLKFGLAIEIKCKLKLLTNYWLQAYYVSFLFQQ